jgi:Holliday junction resolvase RusA-like endonuclease
MKPSCCDDKLNGERFCYVIQGNPIPWARPRLSINRNFYDSQKQKKQKAQIQLMNQHTRPLFNIVDPLHLDIIFYMPIPNMSEKKKLEHCGNYHYIRPDLDNLIKYVKDTATGILYNDDCVIASITSKKIYDTDPRTELCITILDKS